MRFLASLSNYRLLFVLIIVYIFRIASVKLNNLFAKFSDISPAKFGANFQH